MRKNRVHGIVVHLTDNADTHAITERMSQFHADIIERRLQKSYLPTKQKIQIIDKIIERLNTQEIDGIIK